MKKYLGLSLVLVIGVFIGILISNKQWSCSELNQRIEVLEHKNTELQTVLLHNSSILRHLHDYNSNIDKRPIILKRLANEIIRINNYQDSINTIGYRLHNFQIAEADSIETDDLYFYYFMVQEYGIGWNHYLPKEINTILFEPRTYTLRKETIANKPS